MNDSEIVRMYLERDESAIKLTKKKYGSLLLMITNNLLESLPDAEECVADTYIQLWNSIPPNEPDSLASYAAKIARNLSLNRLKYIGADKRKASNCALLLEELREVIPSNVNVEKEVDGKLLTNLIDRFLEALPKHHRIIFIRHYWLFEPVEKIASELGLTKTNVTTSLFRTRQKLKKYLTMEGYNI